MNTALLSLPGILVVASVAGCNYRGGGRATYNPSQGSVDYQLEGRIGVVGQLGDDPNIGDPNGLMIAPEFGMAIGPDRTRAAVAVPSYKYIDDEWGVQLLIDFVYDFGFNKKHGFGPELRLGLIRELRRRDYAMAIIAVDITAGRLFGDHDGWTVGLGASFGHLDQKPRQLK